MYKVIPVTNTVRIPPSELGYDQDEVVRKLVQKSFEGKLTKKHGLTVLATNIVRLGEGRVIHGDGAVYQRVKYDAVAFKPDVGEIVEGQVCEVVEFGAFVRFGPLDGLLHMSQIMNDYLNVDLTNEKLLGKESGRTLGMGDKVRARLVTVSLNELSPRESKIGLTMRQPGLGKPEWLDEERARKEGRVIEKPVGRGGGGAGKGGRGGARGPPPAEKGGKPE
ncbi:MAG: DNA-directed RNA polymerase [Halobacteriales archaeon]|nr:DNA-directed RNA polymerase [Halobacteriales archaeon]